MDIWQLLIQFVFRLGFGVTLAMGITPSRLVTSGFYRVHLWVVMGLNTFAALAIYGRRETLESHELDWRLLLAVAATLGVLSYVGSVIWLYERRLPGKVVLYVASVTALVGAGLATPWNRAAGSGGALLMLADLASSGLLLGVTLAAMLLGHWYLNTPSMQLAPLQRLVLLMIAAVGLRILVSGLGLIAESWSGPPPETTFWIFVAFRWLSGIVGTLIMAIMTWYTLKVPNTQSATGILYAGVILAFIGELASLLLSADTLYPI